MANKIEYIFSLQDKISAKLGGITATSDKTVTALSGVREKVASVDAVCKDTGKTIGSLKMKVDALQSEKEWIPADNLPAIREYNKEIAKLTKEIDALETASGGGKFKKWTSDAFDAIPGAGLLKNPLVAAMATIGFAGKAGMNFDEGMAKVNITAQLDETAFPDLKKKLKKIADDNKTDVILAPVGFEQINSQLNDVDLSLSILDASLKGSKAGFTQLDTVSAALAQTLSIVGKENTTAAEVLDTFFAAKRVGAGEFADFAKYMPNLIAGASNLGVAYKEVAGTFAFMTGKGQSAERAAVLMENAFSILGRGEVRSKLEKAGVKVFDDAGKIRGIVDIFSDLQAVMGGMNDEQKSSMLEKFGLVDKEAKNAFAILTSDIDKLRGSMNDVVNSSGETDKALGFSKNSVQHATEVWNKFKNIGVTVGEIILPVISAGLRLADVILTGVSSTLDVVIGFFSSWYSLLQAGNPLVVGLTAALGFYTLAMAANYAMTQKAVIVGGVKKVVDIAQAAATWGLTTAQWALNAAFYASPLGWVALAIGAVAAIVTYCWQKFEGFRVAILGVWEVIKVFGATLLDSIVKPFKQVLSGIGGVCSAIVNLVKGNFKEAAAAAKDGFKNIGAGVVGANPISILYDTAQNGNYSEAWEKGKQAGHDSWAASQQKTDDLSISKLIPEPVQTVGPTAPAVDFDSLMAKLGKDKKGSAKAKKVIRLDDDAKNLNETAAYTAVTRKLAPLTVSLKPAEVKEQITDKVLPGGNVIAAKTALATKADDRTQNYEPEKDNYLSDIMANVRKIAAAVMLPLAVTLLPPDAKAEPSIINFETPELVAQVPVAPVPDIPVPTLNVPQPVSPDIQLGGPMVNVPELPTAPVLDVPQLSDAYTMPGKVVEKSSFISETTTLKDTGKTVHVDKVCDSVVIHVANTDNKGSETIRAEVMRVLDELAEG